LRNIFSANPCFEEELRGGIKIWVYLDRPYKTGRGGRCSSPGDEAKYG